jgi:hypothetical protein
MPLVTRAPEPRALAFSIVAKALAPLHGHRMTEAIVSGSVFSAHSRSELPSGQIFAPLQAQGSTLGLRGDGRYVLGDSAVLATTTRRAPRMSRGGRSEDV